MFQSKTKITGLGAYLPDKLLTNRDLETMIDTNDDWIVQRTGIRERHIAGESEFSSTLAIRAVDDLVARYRVEIGDVDMIIVTTFTPDHFSPTVSAQVQGHFGMRDTGTMDLHAGCTGFTYALFVANSLITCGHRRKVLVIAAETVSKVVDYTDRATCILFGDAAAACLLECTEDAGAFLGAYFSTDGDLAESVTCPNHSTMLGGRQVGERGIFNQNGQKTYKYVVKNVPIGVRRLLDETGTELDTIDWFVPHSANLRMVEAVCEKLSIPLARTLTSVETCGNTSSVTIPLALWLALRENKVTAGNRLLLYGFGGGLTHGGLVVQL